MAYSYTQTVLQQTVHQKTTIAKTGRLPHYLYSNKRNEVAETMEAYSADMVRSFDVEKENQYEVPEVESTEEEQADQFDSAREEEVNLL